MEVFMGTIQPFGFNFAPRGWAFAWGQQMAISQNSALFALFGTIYGGNGQTTFGLPDLRGRVAIGQGQGPGLSPHSIGEISGTPNVTLVNGNLPAHTHALQATTATATATNPDPTVTLAAPQGEDSNLGAVTVQMYAPPGQLTTLAPQSIGVTGSNLPFSIMQPYLAINYSVALEGIYPSRN